MESQWPIIPSPKRVSGLGFRADIKAPHPPLIVMRVFNIGGCIRGGRGARVGGGVGWSGAGGGGTYHGLLSPMCLLFGVNVARYFGVPRLSR